MKKAVFYIIDRNGQIDLAEYSASTVKKYSEDTTTWLFVDGLNPDDYASDFDRCTALSGLQETSCWWYRRTRAIPQALSIMSAEGYDMAIHMDGDTVLCAGIDEIWQLLSMCDFLGVLEPRRYRASSRGVWGVPDAFVEYNMGFIPVKVIDRVIEFFIMMGDVYEANLGLFGDDQDALRISMWAEFSLVKSIQFLALPSEYNCRFTFPFSLGKPAVVLHGKTKDYNSIARIVNGEPNKMRAWSRGIE